ncbi:MAG: CDP-2,3-bis-(O-geranylgeranyl)-sn-glycerol synthase [Methanosarcinaceae archaeon]|nr:CDP-2,3-bis-(O-geranylgeranyl)-sn-glycerol synthase [Methanosarcinaceae archaeon]
MDLIITAMWLMLPAYVPNPCAAAFGGGRPIDGGRVLGDGRRILGDGKTFRGLFAGITCGLIIGFLQVKLVSGGFAVFGTDLPSFGIDHAGSIKVIFTLAFGSLFGDMFMSFFKRRLGLKRGAPLPVVDQLDFVFGAWVLTYLAYPRWFADNFSFGIIITVLLITPLLHLVTNIFGYAIGVKKEPW